MNRPFDIKIVFLLEQQFFHSLDADVSFIAQKLNSQPYYRKPLAVPEGAPEITVFALDREASERRGVLKQRFTMGLQFLQLDGRKTVLRAIVAVFLILWLLGFVLHIAGNLVHLMVLLALVVLVVDFFARGRART